jgi:hypothetical protein
MLLFAQATQGFNPTTLAGSGSGDHTWILVAGGALSVVVGPALTLGVMLYINYRTGKAEAAKKIAEVKKQETETSLAVDKGRQELTQAERGDVVRHLEGYLKIREELHKLDVIRLEDRIKAIEAELKKCQDHHLAAELRATAAETRAAAAELQTSRLIDLLKSKKVLNEAEVAECTIPTAV